MHNSSGLQNVFDFPLVEALLGRRSRRFALGATLPDGPYDEHFNPGAYLWTHAQHMADWHPENTA